MLSIAYLVSILPLSDSARNYPLAVVCGLLVVTVGGAIRENLATRTAARDSHESAQADVGESTSSLLLTVVLFGVLIVMATRFGVLVAMAVYVPTQLLALNERSPWKLAATTLAAIAVTYFLLYRLLQIPIPL